MKEKGTQDLSRTVHLMRIISKVPRKSILSQTESYKYSLVRGKLMAVMSNTLSQKAF